MKQKAVIVLLILLALSLGGPLRASAQALVRDSVHLEADSYLDQARSAFDAGRASEAGDFLESALQMAPGYSEALLLRARIELTDRNATLSAVDDLRRALASATWNGTDPSVARQTLADVLLRMGKLDDARPLVLRLATRNPQDPRDSLLLARLYQKEGNGRALRFTLADATAKFPLNDDIALLAADLRERDGERSAARQLIRSQLSAHPGAPGLLLRAAQLEPTPGARVAAVDRYTGNGGRDPLAAVVALEAQSRDPQKYLSQFLENGGLSREDLVARVAAAVGGSRSVFETLRSALSRYSGNRDLDPDGEGYVERWTFAAGQPASWVRDSLRDGHPEYSAEFRGGAPVSLTVRADSGALFSLHYGPYPFVQSMTLPASGTSGARSWLVDPFTVRFPFLSAEPTAAGFAPRTLRNPGALSVEMVRQTSYREEDYAPGGSTVVRRIDIDHGRRIFLEEDTLGRGVFDHKVWYLNGQPVRGIRDLDGSGRFPVTETWRDGRLAAIAVDTLGDGKVSYRERYEPSPMKSWDYNEDGIDDAREYPLGAHTVVREFSTRMNGIFDLSFVWRDHDLISVRRGGVWVPVTHDRARGVVWIGRPAPGGVALDSSSSRGYRTFEGRTYLVFDRNDVTYAEELQ